MKNNILSIIILSCLFISCNQKSKTKPKTEPVLEFQNKGHELVYQMVEKVGNYKLLSSKKNVAYTFTYKTPDNKTDITSEKYIFNGELSYGKYTKHQRTLPQLEGVIEQGYDGNEYWLKHNGEFLTDETLLKKVSFNRPTNFYWFTMMQKLLDPGLHYEFLGEKSINNQDYNIVKVSFTSKNNKPTDIYQLYINKKTLLVDQFLFTVADYGKVSIPNLMRLKYENVDGILLPTQRQYKKSTWNADVSNDPWITISWYDIKFNTAISVDDFKKE